MKAKKQRAKSKEKYFEKRAKTYDIYIHVPVISKIRKDERKMLNFLVDNHLGENDSVLEIGCGTGYYTIYAAQRCNDVTAIDLSAKMIRIANKKIQKKGIENVRLMTGDFSKVNFGRKFDKVLCIGVLDYMKDASSFLKRCNDISNGAMIITAPNKSMFSRMPSLLSKIGRHEFKYYTKDELKNSLLKAGFRDVHVYETGIKTKITNGATLIAVARK